MSNVKANVKTARSLTDRNSFGNKAISVALSVVLLGFGWPAVNPSSAYAEDSATENAQVEDASGKGAAPEPSAASPAGDTSAPEAPSATVEVTGSGEQGTASADDAASAAGDSAPSASDAASDAQGSAPSASADNGTSVVALSLGNASISTGGQTLALPATSVTVPNDRDFTFTVAPDNGYELESVEAKVTGAAAATTLDADEDDVYTVSAADVKAGVTIALKTKKAPATSAATDAAAGEGSSSAGSNGSAAASGDPEATEIGKDTVIGKGDDASGAGEQAKEDAANQGDGLFDEAVSGIANGTFDPLSGLPLGSEYSGTYYLDPGEVFDLSEAVPPCTAGLSPWNGEWYSSDYKIARIDSGTDVITADSWFTGTITITYKHWIQTGENAWEGEYHYDYYQVIVGGEKPADTAELTLSGDDTVEQFSTIQLTASVTPDKVAEGGTYAWKSSNDNILTVDENGVVSGILQGTATVTCTFTSADGKTVLTATHDVTVTASAQAGEKTKFYYLNNPNANLDDIKTQAVWTFLGWGNANYSGIKWGKDNGKTKIYDRVGDRVVNWPDGATGATYEVERGSSDWNRIVSSYQDEIKKQLPDMEVTDDMIESVTLIPYKMTFNDDGKHVDCRVEVKCAHLFTAKYFVNDPTNTSSSGFVEVAGNVSYRAGDTTEITDLVPDFDAKYPQTKTAGGVDYTFDGWYTDSALTKRAVFPYTMTGNVSFYAKYVSGRQVIYDLAGGSWNNSDAPTYVANEGSKQTVKPEPTREGCVFMGWTVDGLEGKTDIASGDVFVMPDNNVTITAQWRELASCTIKYVEKSTGAELKASEKKYGEVGDTVSATAASIEGYHLADCPESVEAVLGEDGSEEIVFTYEKDSVAYTVNHYLNGTETAVAPSETFDAPWGTEISASDVLKSIEGCTEVPDQTQSITLSRDGDNVISVYYYRNVELTANSDTFTYDGTVKSVSGFTGAPEEADFSALSVGAEGTDAGTYKADFDADVVGTVDATGKYLVVSAENGTLTINPCADEIVVKVVGATKNSTYDGTEQSVSGYELSVETSSAAAGEFDAARDVEGPEQSAAVAAGTNAGSYPMGLTAGAFSNKNANFANVKFEVADGTLTIAKREVTITAGSAEKEYDGTALTADQADPLFTADGFVEGEGIASVEVEGSQTQVGTSNSTVKDGSWTFAEGTNGDNYTVKTAPGTLTVNPRPEGDRYELTVEGNSATETYDGTAHSVSGIKSSTYTNSEGVSYTVTADTSNPSRTDAGTSANEVTNVKVVDAFGNDVTDQFDITVTDGALTVNQREVTITAGSAEKEYDGTALTADQADPLFTADGFVEGEGIAGVEVEGSQTQVGASNSTVKDGSWTFAEGTNGDNYTVKTAPGTLTVKNRAQQYAITLVGKSAAAVYDGTTHEVEGVDQDVFTFDGVSYTVSNYVASATGVNAGEYANTVTSGEGGFVVTDPEGNNVSDQFSVNVAPGKLTIGKRPVVLVADSATKPYDGTPLTVGGTAFTATDPTEDGTGGFVEGQGVSWAKVSGSQTEVGTSSSTFAFKESGKKTDFMFIPGTDPANYDISYKDGTLEVTPNNDEVVVTIVENSGTKVYDGTEQSVTGYTVGSISNAAYNAADIEFVGSDAAKTASGTDAGTYDMNLSSSDFRNASGNFTNVTFKIVDGTLTISKRAITLQSEGAEKEYDGTELTNGNVNLKAGTFASGDGFMASATGSQTNAGASDNDFTYTLVDENGAELAKGDDGTYRNYEVTTEVGTLRVTPVASEVVVAIVGNHAEGTYNGASLTAFGYTFASSDDRYTESKVTFSGTSEVSRTNAGKSAMGLAGTFANADAVNFPNVRFEVTDGYVDIAKAKVTLKSADLSKPYDGAALMNGEEPLATETGWAEGEGASYTFSGSQTIVGSTENAFTYKLNDGTLAENYVIDAQYGTLTVTNRDAKYAITVEANSSTNNVYDGTVHSATGLKASTFEIEGHTYTVSGLSTEDPAQVNAGSYTNNITGSPVVTDEAGNDVTAQFEVTPVNGVLEIAARNVTLTSADDEKEYDGEPLVNHGITIGGQGFVGEYEGVICRFTGSQTEVGGEQGNNAFSYIFDVDTIPTNYNITLSFGTLTVKPTSKQVVVVIDGESATKTYNGSAQSATGYRVASISNPLFTEADIDFTGEAQATGVDASSTPYAMGLTESQFSNKKPGVFSNVKFVVNDGSLTIDKRSVKLTAASDSKPYDGTELTNSAVSVAGDGFVPGEVSNVRAEGGITNVGTTTNKVAYDANAAFKSSNYTIETTDGTLEITPSALDAQSVVWKTSDVVELYDGTAHHAGTAYATDKYGAALDVEYSADGVNWTSDPADITAKNYSDSTVVYLRATSPNYTEGSYATAYELLAISKRFVTLTSASDSKKYDGTALENHNVTVGLEGWAEGEGASFNVTGSQTEAGQSSNAFTYELNDGTLAENYVITQKPGTLVVSANDADVLVTITEHSDSVTYDGEEHTVSGYDVASSNGLYGEGDFSFSGDATAKGAEVGTYDMKLAPTDFANTSSNFSRVTFVIVDGALTITPKAIDAAGMSVEAPQDVVYNGTSQKQKPIVKDGDTLLGEGKDYTLSYSDDTVNVGDVTVTVKGMGNYAGSTDVRYRITPATAYVTTESASKPYDGTALTAPGSIELVNGETATVTPTSSRTEVGDEPNSTYTIEWNGTGRVSNYTVAEKSIGTLTVTSQSIDPKAPSYNGVTVSDPADAMYDGTEHKWTPEVKAANGMLLTEGRDYTVSYDTDDFVSANDQITVTIEGAGNYAGSVVKTYKIAKRPVVVASNTRSRTYTGTPLTDSEAFAVGYYDFVAGDVSELKATGSITEPGTVDNAIEVTWAREGASANYDIELRPGTLTVNAKSIAAAGMVVEAPEDVVYNGLDQYQKPIVKDGDTQLTEGTDYTLSIESDTVNAGTVVITVTGIGNYTGSVQVSYLIKKAPLTVTTASDSKPYDGEALTAGGTVKGLVNDETVTFATIGSQTVVGSSTNWYSLVWDGTASPSNYEIAEELGTLTVTESENEIVVTTTGYDGPYTGTPHGATVTVTNLPAGYTAEATSNAEATDANGEGITATADNLVVYNTNREDVTSSLTITRIDGTIKIAPAELSVVTSGATKVYDGEPLTAGAKVSGFVNGEVADIEATGSQTEVGSTPNTYRIVWNDNAKESNYMVTSEEIGTLTVTEFAGQIIVRTTGGTFTYDGAPHGATDVSVSELPTGYTLETAESTTTVRNVDDGVKTVTADNLVIRNAQGEDVTASLNIAYVDDTVQVTPAPLEVTTGSASRYYDGTALVNRELRIDGIVEGDQLLGKTTGSQTEVGSSENTYQISGESWDHGNYVVVKETLGMLTVYAPYTPPTPDPDNPNPPAPDPDNPNPPTPDPDNPTPGPTPDNPDQPTPSEPENPTTPTTPETPSTPMTPSAPTTPADTNGTTNAPAANPAVNAVAQTMVNVYNAMTGDDATVEPAAQAEEELIYDAENPLGLERSDVHCWVHFYMIVFMVLTALYGAGVMARRANFTRRLSGDAKDVLGGSANSKA